MKNALRTKFLCELKQLTTELTSYQTEANYFHKNIANSVGNLALNLIGKLDTYMALRSARPATSHRPPSSSSKTFRATLCSKKILLPSRSLELSCSDSARSNCEPYPQGVCIDDITTAYFPTYLAMHLSYHLGQVNYHRRLLD